MLSKEIIVREFGEKISRLSHRMIFDNELAREATQEGGMKSLRILIVSEVIPVSPPGFIQSRKERF
jgi:hypothetical protein